MSDDQFTRLFSYMEKRFNGVDARFEGVEGRLGKLEGTVAELSARLESYHDEVLVLSHQFNQLRQSPN